MENPEAVFTRTHRAKVPLEGRTSGERRDGHPPPRRDPHHFLHLLGVLHPDDHRGSMGGVVAPIADPMTLKVVLVRADVVALSLCLPQIPEIPNCRVVVRLGAVFGLMRFLELLGALAVDEGEGGRGDIRRDELVRDETGPRGTDQ